MSIYPVIMCGGAGTRLWPASRPSRPKQFIPLSGNRSLFQETALRVAPLVDQGGRLIVVGGVKHRDWIVEQLAELDLQAHVLLEPDARDSAPAMAAAAIWAANIDPDAVIAFVASDHHIPDGEAFRAAVTAAADGARAGRLVTLGVQPNAPSAAYGYIKPAGKGLSDVSAFVEKPDKQVAAEYIAAGYLWNSGNFIVSAKTLEGELKAYAPAVESAARASVAALGLETVQVLSPAFLGSPRISIDYAVMEKTSLASVLAVDFDWSDLGSWDAIFATGEGNVGNHIYEDAEGCLVRTPDGVIVAALGVKNLAIIVENDAVMVCNLGRSQDVKKLVDRVRDASPQHLDFEQASMETLSQGATRFAEWLRLRALPIWSTLGLNGQGEFVEALNLDGRPFLTSRRARVQTRQIYVYAQAGLLRWQGPWRSAVASGLDNLTAQFLRGDGLCAPFVTADGVASDGPAALYDQAFLLLALATAQAAGVDDGLEARAVKVREKLLEQALPAGGFKEVEPHPYQSNAHMHLLEACLAWEESGQDAGWADLADKVVELALGAFIDPNHGFLGEFFTETWKPAPGEDGRLVEPGHQFEWSWLLTRYAISRGDDRARSAALNLYKFGVRGIASRPAIAVDALNADGSVRSNRARLWPQTEWLKAALILASESQGIERDRLLGDAASAMRALWLYLTPEGLWKDKHLEGGNFLDEPAPASSFYHIVAAFKQLTEVGGPAGSASIPTLSLG